MSAFSFHMLPFLGYIEVVNVFYPTALKGCRGIVFTHGDGRVGVRADGGKKFVQAVSQKL